MRDLKIILNNPRLSKIELGIDGFRAIYTTHKFSASLIVSTGAGWEHVSIAPLKWKYIPTWEDMCTLKELIFEDNEAVIQIHPPKAEYVNQKENCLHLWRCTYKPMVLPPSILVGIRKGQTKAEIEKEIREAYEMAGEKYEG